MQPKCRSGIIVGDATQAIARLRTLKRMTAPDKIVESPLDGVTGVLDALNCGAFLIDRSGLVVHANPRLCDMFGLPFEQLLGRNMREFYTTAEAREQVDQIIRNFDEPSEREFHIPRADGSKLAVIVSGRRLSGAPPLPEHRVGTVVDISQQKEEERSRHEQYLEVAKLSDTVIEQAIELKSYSKKLEERVRARTAELHEANMDAILMLAVASEAKDMETGAHVRRIQHFSEAIARGMGMDATEAERMGYSAILHDVGKIQVPDHILQKPGRLTAEERAVVETHTIVGERILSRKRFFDVARQIARSHHENWDGSGYPDGLSGEAIPLCARIVRTADVYDALTKARVYKPAWSAGQAVDYLRDESGRLFDRQVVDAFLELISEDQLGPAGLG